MGNTILIRPTKNLKKYLKSCRKVLSSPNLTAKLKLMRPKTKLKKVKLKTTAMKIQKCIMTKRSLSLTQFPARPRKRPKVVRINPIGEQRKSLIAKHLEFLEIIAEVTIDVEVKMEAPEVAEVITITIIEVVAEATIII